MLVGVDVLVGVGVGVGFSVGVTDGVGLGVRDGVGVGVCVGVGVGVTAHDSYTRYTLSTLKLLSALMTGSPLDQLKLLGL